MQISNSAIDKIGEIIRRGPTRSSSNSPNDDSKYDEALTTLNAWREAHGPLADKYYDQCVELADEIGGKNIIVAQRLKRLPTITGKLNRFKSMRLSRMQDIAGVRMIVEDMAQLKEIEQRIKGWDSLVDVDDYLSEPKPSGYRGKHFIFKEGGMFVELQLRTQLEHLWATSVETTDILRGASLKEKDDDTCWHDFFCQISSIFAIAEETKVVAPYQDLTLRQICELFIDNVQQNGIYSQIVSFTLVDPVVNRAKVRGAYYAVIAFNLESRVADVFSYKEADYRVAFAKYQELERQNTWEKQAVLVAVNRVKELREAYPNYFLNLAALIDIMNYLIAKNKN